MTVLIRQFTTNAVLECLGLYVIFLSNHQNIKCGIFLQHTRQHYTLSVIFQSSLFQSSLFREHWGQGRNKAWMGRW